MYQNFKQVGSDSGSIMENTIEITDFHLSGKLPMNMLKNMMDLDLP